jgi:hypothetical protein
MVSKSTHKSSAKKVPAGSRTAKSVARETPPERSPARNSFEGDPVLADVTVRMFCQGLGDCFLITIPQADSRPYSILIDFGVALGTPSADVIMRQAVVKIAELTQGVINLAVTTHEHWDHVSGYVLASDELKKKLTFKHLWVAWTEDENDTLAKALRKEFTKAKAALMRAASAPGLNDSDKTSRQRLRALNGVLAFYGVGAAKKDGGSVADAMQLPHKLVDEAHNSAAVDYLKPGECRTLPGATGYAADLQAFVLGPPRDRTKLRRLNPSTKGEEGYEKKKGDAPGVAFNWSWMASAMSHQPDIGEPADADDEMDGGASFPFYGQLRISADAAKRDPRFARYYASTAENALRRIDNDWLWVGAQRLALKMDSYTNNTCLVLAFELPKSKRILLFPADAQAGNWLSWHDQNYHSKDGRELSATDLLNKTCLYKVGHHGSHNATLRKKGLELMTQPDLVAMLPVEADGVTRLGYGQMPLRSLMQALREKTGGRILRIDEKWTNSKAPGTWNKQGLCASLSTEQITVGPKGKTSKRPLYMELSLRDG